MRMIFVASWVLLVVLADHSFARPPYKQGLKRSYGDALPQLMQACSTCHLTKQQVENAAEFDELAPPHNTFGIRLAKLGEELKAKGQAAEIVARVSRSARRTRTVTASRTTSRFCRATIRASRATHQRLMRSRQCRKPSMKSLGSERDMRGNRFSQ